MLHQSLEGIRVLDLTRLFPGPLCTMMLADLGAEVIKIEAPEGELARYIPPYQFGSGVLFLQLNRGKRSLTLNLKSEQGQAILNRMLEQTDILVESFRPGVMRRFHLDYDSTKERYPSLIYCSISGYGQTGPMAAKPGHDLNYLSMAGIISLSGDDTKGYLIPPIQIADTMSAFTAVSSILAALFQRSRIGKGQFLDISLLDAAFFAMVGLAGIHLAGFPLQADVLPLSGRLACYNIYRTKDNKFLALAFLEPKFWQTFCLKMKMDQYFNHQLQNDQTELIEALRNKFKTKSLQEWLDFFEQDDLCISPVRNFPEVLADPMIQSRGLVTEVQYPSGILKQMMTPIVSGAGSRIRAPLLGEHNVEILLEHGYSSDQIESLRKQGVI
jgi:crotonobetainyl-CoA:carnitine CoA-transferase CaiB-like acyl-CoA transferase